MNKKGRGKNEKIGRMKNWNEKKRLNCGRRRNRVSKDSGRKNQVNRIGKGEKTETQRKAEKGGQRDIMNNVEIKVYRRVKGEKGGGEKSRREKSGQRNNMNNVETIIRIRENLKIK